jgi:putative tryptophan/tyrosine transport system substrate-binding protein
MRRRGFIVLLCGAAVAWSPAVQAQRAERIRRVGVLMTNEGDVQGLLAAFQETLRNFGWIEGQNLKFDIVRTGSEVFAEGKRGYAAEMVALAPDVILAGNAPTALSLKRETAKIPIVFASGSDPVRNGLVTNLARPERNVTGFPATVPSLGGKWLDLLKQLAPNSKRLAIVEAPENPVLAEYWSAAQIAAQGRIVELTKIEARDDAQIHRQIGDFARDDNGALLVLPGASTFAHVNAILDTAAQYHLPAIYPWRSFAVSGGLMSYGTDNANLFRRAAGYVDRILRGESVSNLPVQLPTKFELVINLKTAKTLGLAVPEPLLVAADEVIE